MLVGKNKEGVDVAGSIRVPECAYDTEEDEYVVSALPSKVARAPFADCEMSSILISSARPRRSSLSKIWFAPN
jgi:hypothetical protein